MSTSPHVQKLVYSDAHPGLTLTYIPASTPPTSSSPPPLFFFIHGGAFVLGDSLCIAPHIIALAKSVGAAIASINYRLCPEV